MSCDHFNYVDLIHIFEDYNGLNITVITKIMTVVTSQTLVIWMCFYLHRIVMWGIKAGALKGSQHNDKEWTEVTVWSQYTPEKELKSVIL